MDAASELADADLELMLVRQGLELRLHHPQQPRQRYPALSRDLVAPGSLQCAQALKALIP